MRRKLVMMVPTVDATDLTEVAYEYCDHEGISTHYDQGIHQLHLNGNPLQKFFEDNGVDFQGEEYAYIGVIGT